MVRPCGRGLVCQSATRVLVSMQLLSASLAFALAPSSSNGHLQAQSRQSAGAFLDRSTKQPDLTKFNDEILAIRKKIDALELQCKLTELKDKETIDGLDRELRQISGQLAGNLALQSSAQHAAEQDKAESVKLKGQLIHITSMCDTQKKNLNATAQILLRDKGRANDIRGLSAACGYAALTAIHSSVSVADNFSSHISLMQGCSEEAAAPIVAAGQAIAKQAQKFESDVSKKEFAVAVQHASITSQVLLESSAWPSKAKPPSKAKAKAANACKISKGAVDCDKLKSRLDTLAMHLEEQKEVAVTNMRKQVEECGAKEKSINDRIKSADAAHARNSAELVRLTGVKAGMAASRAAIVQRLERTKRDAKKFARTCESGADDYKGRIEDVLRSRQKAAEEDAGERLVIQDCKVTDWRFSKCSKACKKTLNETAGTIEATREVAGVPGMEGHSCPPLSAKLPCNDKPCPVHCAVSEWVPWSACSKACGGGTKKRTRSVVTQTQNGGKACPSTEQRKICNVGRCGDECKLKPWTPWSACSRRCRFSENTAAGRQTRSREVDGNPVAEGGGNPCPPADDKSRFDSRSCNDDICPAGITCDASQDILFLLDGSGAADTYFSHQANLVLNFVGLSSEKVHVGVISYGKKVEILSRITGDRYSLRTLDGFSPVAGGSRDVARAEVMGRTLFSDPGVGRGRPKIAVILLGGAPAGFREAKKAADELRAANVRIVVGLVDDGSQIARDQACAIASAPCEANVESVKSWQDMEDKPGRFLASVCRNLVYPGPKLNRAEKMLADDQGPPRKEKPAKGNYGEKDMPKWIKRQLKIK